MAELGYAYDSSTVKDERQVMPKHACLAQIIESEIVPTKNGKGQLLKLTWELVDGDFAKRRCWAQINIQHESAEAQAIGQRDLKRIVEAMGLGVVTNTEVLHFKPIPVTVDIEAGKNGYEDKNIIRVKMGNKAPGSPPGAAPQSAQAGGTAAASAPAAPAAGSRPWAK